MIDPHQHYSVPVKHGESIMVWHRRKKYVNRGQARWWLNPTERGSSFSPDLNEDCSEWCLNTFDYIPEVRVYKNRAPHLQIWIRFANKDDYTLFHVKYGEFF